MACSPASSVSVKNGYAFQTVATMTAPSAVSSLANQARSVESQPACRSSALTTPKEPSSSHRKTMLTITPGTAQGSRMKLRNQRRPGNTRLSSNAVNKPMANAGPIVPTR